MQDIKAEMKRPSGMREDLRNISRVPIGKYKYYEPALERVAKLTRLLNSWETKSGRRLVVAEFEKQIQQLGGDGGLDAVHLYTDGDEFELGHAGRRAIARHYFPESGLAAPIDVLAADALPVTAGGSTAAGASSTTAAGGVMDVDSPSDSD